MLKKSYLTLIILISCLTNISYAQTATNNTVAKKSEDKMDLSTCIKKAIENNLDLKLLEVQKQNKLLDIDKAQYYKNTLGNGKAQLKYAQQSLNTLTELYRQLAPLPDGFVIPDNMTGGKLPSGTTKAGVLALINDISGKINASYYTVSDTLQNLKVEELLEFKAQTESDLVDYAALDAKSKISLLIQNTYYEAIKNKKIMELKKDTYDRVLAQEKLANLSYQKGMKPQDDLLLCQILKSFSNIDYINAQRIYNSSIIDMKKNMNIDFNTELNLKDQDFKVNILNVNLEAGIKSGMQNRFDIKKANAEELIAKLNFEITKRAQTENTFDYREAKLKYDEISINNKKTKINAEAEVRKSYDTLTKTEEMLKDTIDLIKKAQKTVDIAKKKYDFGFDFPSATLKDLHLEDASGTIVEVLAAQEKLDQVKEKYIELLFNYNLAKQKYLYDIGQNF